MPPVTFGIIDLTIALFCITLLGVMKHERRNKVQQSFAMLATVSWSLTSIGLFKQHSDRVTTAVETLTCVSLAIQLLMLASYRFNLFQRRRW